MSESFDSAFIVPFASHSWQSARGRSHWVEMEGWQNSMAGPISSVAKRCECDYVYQRDDWYFANVVNPETLHHRLMEWHAGLLAGLMRFEPTSVAETEDLKYMQCVADKMRALIEQACEIERVRWTTE